MKGDEFFAQVAGKPPFSKLHPRVAAFFKDYLANEKVVAFRDKHVVNTHFPPYPSPAFTNLAEGLNRIGDAHDRRLHSVTFAVTNRCPYNCWHCYNAGRSQHDLPLDTLIDVARQLQDLGTVMVALSGGEPLLRKDLAELAAEFDDSTCLTLNTTGVDLTPDRASALRDAGLFAVGVSLDSEQADEHDRMRGIRGAFSTALRALEVSDACGLYPYIVSVATRKFLQPENFWAFIRFAGRAGAKEVHLLEPCPVGKLADSDDAVLTEAEKQQILEYQRLVAEDEDLPILSSFTYLESPKAFGCGAGLTHLYVDGSGEVCPCNLVPLSFGNVTDMSLRQALDRMGEHFRRPRPSCVGQLLTKHVPGGDLPAAPETSCEICRAHLPREHALPLFFSIQSESREEVGARELTSAYNQVHGSYDAFWLTEAGKPTDDLVVKLSLTGNERIFEAGCGTGYATVQLAGMLGGRSSITAVDLSGGMLEEARARAGAAGVRGIRFLEGDALQLLEAGGPFDLVFSSWVLGYIPLRPFFAASAQALSPRGRLAFVVHKENSPREPLEIFGELVARDPTVLQKRVSFDFPENTDHLRREIDRAGLEIQAICDGEAVFRYPTAEQVLEHLLKSGAGTAFHDSLDPRRRTSLEREFVEMLNKRHEKAEGFEVTHDYIACIARKP